LHTNDLATHEVQIEFREVFQALLVGKKLILGVTSIFATASLLLALLLPNQYTSVAVLAPANDSSGSLPRAFSQLTGIASLAGVKLGSGVLTEVQIAEEVMRSWSFIDSFINDNNLAVDIYAGVGWDKENNKLEIDSELYDEVNNKWLIETDSGTREPTSWELFKRFEKILSIASSDEGLLSITVLSYSPFLAKKWVDLFVQAINKHMQLRKLSMINSNIAYLEAEIEKSLISGMHQVFYTIIEEQIKSKMISEATPEHTFILISPSMVPEVESEPKRLLICVLGTFFGVILSIFICLLLFYKKSSRSAS
jgi:capsular polysaccharide biosynthesis protein